MRLATPQELEQWDDLLVKLPNGGDVFQTRSFANTKIKQGWRAKYIIYDLHGQKLPCLFLVRNIPVLGQLWYAPKGPGITDSKHLQLITKANYSFAKSNHIFLFKIEPDIAKQRPYPKALHKAHNIQPNANTVIIDLSPSEDQILGSFRQRARRAIRQAQNAGITIKTVANNNDNFKKMYDLYKTTGSRAGFYVRDFNYYQNLWHNLAAASQGQLFFAYNKQQLIAAAFVAFIGHKGLYKDGASDRDALKNGAAHLLQWEAMRWLKQKGITSYDLHGTPPAEELTNPNHKFYGLGLFKTSFNKNLTEFVGTLDQPINQTAYKLWRKYGERAAQSLQYRLRGRSFY